MSISVHTIYCDDIRPEQGGKQSLMGVYNAVMLVPSFPTAIPKLCLQISVRIPLEDYPDSLVVRVALDDTVIAEAPLGSTDMANMQELTRLQPENEGMMVALVFMFNNLTLEEPVTLRTYAIAAGNEIKGNSLVVRQPTSDEAIDGVVKLLPLPGQN